MPKSYEDKFTELTGIVEAIEKDVKLEDALKLFEKGIKLSRECHAALNQAEKKIETLLDATSDTQKHDTTQ